MPPLLLTEQPTNLLFLLPPFFCFFCQQQLPFSLWRPQALLLTPCSTRTPARAAGSAPCADAPCWLLLSVTTRTPARAAGPGPHAPPALLPAQLRPAGCCCRWPRSTRAAYTGKPPPLRVAAGRASCTPASPPRDRTGPHGRVHLRTTPPACADLLRLHLAATHSDGCATSAGTRNPNPGSRYHVEIWGKALCLATSRTESLYFLFSLLTYRSLYSPLFTPTVLLVKGQGQSKRYITEVTRK